MNWINNKLNNAHRVANIWDTQLSITIFIPRTRPAENWSSRACSTFASFSLSAYFLFVFLEAVSNFFSTASSFSAYNSLQNIYNQE